MENTTNQQSIYITNWFCTTFLSKFLNNCKKSNIDIKNTKEKIIKFIQDF